MKKTILSILTIAALASSSYALDMSSDSSQSQKSDIDDTMNYKKGKDSKRSQAERQSKTSTSDKSLTQSKELSVGEQYNLLSSIMVSEKTGEDPFSSCNVLTNPKLSADFGLSSEDEEGDIDSIFADILQKSANNNALISKVGADEYEVKDYINCAAYYGAIIAQGMKKGVYSTEIKDEKIQRTFEDFQIALSESRCRFNGATTNIQCGSISLKIDTTPNVSFSGIPLYSDQTFFGYNGKTSVNKAKSQRIAFERQQQKETMRSTSISKDASLSFKATASEDVSSKTSFSPRNWLPE